MTDTKSVQRRWMVALGLFALALAVRLVNAGKWSFWVDEVLVVARAQELLATGAVEEDWPKLSLLLNGLALRALGVNEWAARIVSVVAGAALIPVVYVSTSRLVRPRAGFWAALLMVFSPWHIMLSQNARYYAVLILLVYLALVLVCVGRGKGSVRWYALAVALVGLAFAERPFAALVLPAPAAMVVCRLWPGLGGKRRKAWQRLAIAYLGMVVIACVGYGIVQFWLRDYIPAIDRKLAQIGGTRPTMSPTGTLSKLVSDYGMPLVALGLSGLLLPQRDRLGLVELSVLVAIQSLPIILGFGLFVRVFSRYMMFALPCWAIMAGDAIDRAMDRRRVSLVAVAGIMPLTLYDRMWDDVAYFTGVPAIAFRLASGGLCVLVLVTWLVHSWPDRREWWPRCLVNMPRWLDAPDALATPALILALVYALGQPLIADVLYHQQDGMRLDWEPVLAVLDERLGPNDGLFTGEYRVVMFHYGRPVADVRAVERQHLEDYEGTVWFVADHYSAEIVRPEVADWVAECCENVAYTGYMYRGRWWDMILYECPQCGGP